MVSTSGSVSLAFHTIANVSKANWVRLFVLEPPATILSWSPKVSRTVQVLVTPTYYTENSPNVYNPRV